MDASDLNKPIPTTISFDETLKSSLKTLLKATALPKSPPIDSSAPWELGIDLKWLSELKTKFESDEWKVDDLLGRINKWKHYLVKMKASEDPNSEVVEMHFMHIKSTRKDAIPLMMVHGWPGVYPPRLSSKYSI